MRSHFFPLSLKKTKKNNNNTCFSLSSPDSVTYKIQRCFESERLVLTAHVFEVFITVASLDIFSCKIKHTHRHTHTLDTCLLGWCEAAFAVDRMLPCRRP